MDIGNRTYNHGSCYPNSSISGPTLDWGIPLQQKPTKSEFIKGFKTFHLSEAV